MLFGKKLSVEEVISSEEFKQFVENITKISSKQAIEELSYTDPKDSVDFKRLLDDYNTLKNQYQKALSDYTNAKTELNQTEDSFIALKTKIEELTKQTEELEKTLADERRNSSEIMQKNRSYEFELAKYKSKANEAHQTFYKHKEMFELLKNKPRIYLLLTDNESEISLEHFIFVSSTWDYLTTLQKNFSSWAKKEHREMNSLERGLLNLFFESYNSIRTKKAELVNPKVGDDFNPDLHDAVNKTGTQIKAVWVPGLISIRGAVSRKAVVVVG